MPRTLATELVGVQPMQHPHGSLFGLSTDLSDFRYALESCKADFPDLPIWELLDIILDRAVGKTILTTFMEVEVEQHKKDLAWSLLRPEMLIELPLHLYDEVAFRLIEASPVAIQAFATPTDEQMKRHKLKWIL